MSETELGSEGLGADGSQLDEDDRLKPEFVRKVLDAVYDGVPESARALVEPLQW